MQPGPVNTPVILPGVMVYLFSICLAAGVPGPERVNPDQQVHAVSVLLCSTLIVHPM